MAGMELGERKQKILTAVIDAYIRTGEPVGSKALVEMLDNAVSSATIRNEMAELSAMGYLEQPHTSAGRIPTAKAFRLYIDRLMRRQPLSEADRKGIDSLLSGASGDPERLIEEASQALAQATGCAAVTTTPAGQAAYIRRIEVLRASPRMAALLLMTGSGVLRTRVCRFGQDIDDETLERLSKALSASFSGAELSEVGLPQVQSLMAALGESGLLCAPALTAFYELVQESAEAEIRLAGQLNLLRYPDYDPGRARELLDFLAQIRDETGVTLTELNLGGGFGIPYTENDHPKACGEYMRLVAGAVKARAAKWGLPVPFMVIEPGRSVVAQAGITLYTVGGIKEIPDVRTYFSVDGGMPDNPRYALYKSEYTCLIANKADQPADTTVTVAGRCCESGDLLQENTPLQACEPGDILAVLATGAYNYSMSSNYNRLPRPAIVMVNGDTSRVVVKAETYEDLVRNDL